MEKVGKVVSTKMMKSVVVSVERMKMFPKYGGGVRRHKNFTAHDEFEQCKEGDIVRIHSCRPLSKTKSFYVKEILSREKTEEELLDPKVIQTLDEERARKRQWAADLREVAVGFAAKEINRPPRVKKQIWQKKAAAEEGEMETERVSTE